ncbi:MAG TPA: peptide ABC transporter permease, partial [Thermomicrobiales bacterium]|nr:peptide ABC transporter permease [Thermomicrobiales bacterium]
MGSTAAAAAELSGTNLPQPRLISQRQRAWRAFKSNKSALVGLILIVVIILVAILAPLLATHDPLSQSTINRLQNPSADHWLGTDSYGRDVYSRILYGTRVALMVGVLSV